MPAVSFVVAVVQDFRIVGFLGKGRRFVNSRAKAHAYSREDHARRVLSRFVGTDGSWTEVKQIVGSLRVSDSLGGTRP